MTPNSDPRAMSRDERVLEIAAILATGYQRLLDARREQDSLAEGRPAEAQCVDA